MRFVIFLFFVVSFFVGCSTKIEQQIWNNIAEVREFICVGKNDDMSVSLVCGKREIEYKADGYATELVPFGVITVNWNNVEVSGDLHANYILYVGTEKFCGDLIRNPFDGTLVADIGKIVDKNKNLSIDVVIDDQKTSMKLKSIDDNWSVSYRECVDILIKQYNDELKTFFDEEFEGEVYIKIMDDYDKYSSDYYYYVSVVGRGGSSINMIISPETGEILASSSNILPKSN